ncbi:MAG: sugar transferase [Planctomycetaceae bacterium]|nr:sugar transferase [Planctomycetaceae bacterium]
MKIVITGASGFVGQNIVPLLLRAGAELLLIGRDPRKLQRLFPGQNCRGYEELACCGAGYDVVLHLAVVNNNSKLPPEAFHATNVDHLLQVAEAARRAGIPRFINVSSVHALDPHNQTAYARSKRTGAEQLQQIEGIESRTLFLPLVYADRWSGKLAILNRLPKPLATLLFRPLAALKPTVHVKQLAEFVLRESSGPLCDEVILVDDQDRNLVFRGIKRSIDLLFALTVLACFWWGLLIIWALVRLQSAGPGIFAQERIGRSGRSFTCYKFRTMKQGTVQAGTHEVSARAVTPIGNLLRKTKIDELPQIWNILRNEISLIGPRPCLPVQTELIEARRVRGVLDLKPGISGLAQINGIDMSDPEKLARWDARYKALRSLLLELKIAIATALGGGQGDKVRKEATPGTQPAESEAICSVPPQSAPAKTKGKPRLLFLISDGDFFLSHRLPLALEAARAGYEIGIACPPHADSDRYAELGFTYLPIRMLRMGTTPFSELRSLLSIASVIRGFRPDLVHQITSKPIIYGGIISRCLGIPTVSAISGLGYVFTNDTPRVRLLRKLAIAGYKLSINSRRNHVIFQNEDDLGLFRKHGIIGRVSHSLIPGSGTDLARITPQPLPEGQTVLVLPARLLRDKGVVEFVEAARLLISKGIPATFRLLGDPDNSNPTSISREQLAAWVREGVVEWHGYTKEIGAALAQAHIVVLPSYREGFPKTLIDAAAAGRASAATDVPGCRDAIVQGETGLLFLPRNAADMARVLEPLILDRDRQAAMGLAARRHAERVFDIQAVCQKHLEIYDSLTHSPSDLPANTQNHEAPLSAADQTQRAA